MSHATIASPARADGPDTSDYAIIHHAIRSAGRALAEAAATLTAADPKRLDAFVRYWQGHTGEILSHHGIEDTIFFPALLARVPESAAVLEQLDGEHHRLDTADGGVHRCPRRRHRRRRADRAGRAPCGASPT